MFNFFKQKGKKDNTREEIRKIAKKELRENRKVLESLRDYDAGKKDIHTGAVRERLRNI